jgi:actin-like ATPase involved in cell morphogenesis
MAVDLWGLDFGTTNSLLTIIGRDGKPVHLTDDTERPHPSVVWYRASEIVVGREARKHLDAGSEAISGDFVRSPKRLLEQDALQVVGGQEADARKIIADVLRFLKSDAEGRLGESRRIDRAVMTIPVKLDGAGRRRLREAAREAGIGVIQFVHEPLAALYAYLRRKEDFARRLTELDRCRILVFDWGGGTLDLTLCEVVGDQIIQIANVGDNDVGGDRFDEAIRNEIRDRHAREHGISELIGAERPEAKIKLLNQCELAKIQLSERDSVRVFVSNYLKTDGPGRNLAVTVTQADLNEWTRSLVERGLAAIDRLLEANGISPTQIALCLPTGGMVQMPAIRAGLQERFGPRTERLNDGDRIISEGAAWIAHDRLKLGLAKPIELLQPDQTYASIVQLPFELPMENDNRSIKAIDIRCADPRSGRASFVFARPNRPRPRDARSDRLIYTTTHLEIDPQGPPLAERIDLAMTIDHDYVAKIDMSSSMRRGHVSAEIYDLEFTLRFPRPTARGPLRESGESDRDSEAQSASFSFESASEAGAVRLQSNVVVGSNWGMVPGDIVVHYRQNWFDERTREYSSWQRVEFDYYRLCTTCKRTRYDFRMQDCHHDGFCIWRHARKLERKISPSPRMPNRESQLR